MIHPSAIKHIVLWAGIKKSILKSKKRCREQIHGHQGGKGGWDKLGDWDWPIYIIDTMYKIDN